MHFLRNLIISAVLCCLCVHSYGQLDFTPTLNDVPVYDKSDTLLKVHVSNIHISGNNRTKDYIIKRELYFKPGDSIVIVHLNDVLEKARQQVYNTTLFVEVNVEPHVVSAHDIDISVSVKEKWYIYPLPEFQLVDRSVNEWLVEYDGSLERVNYGLKFVHYNLSGRKDQLKVGFINGYSRDFNASYNAPYANPSLTIGYFLSAGFSQNREIAYKTNTDNKFVFFSNGSFVRSTSFINGGLTLRKAIKKTHIFNIGYAFEKVIDSLVSSKYNPNYFNYNGTSKGFIDLSYTFQYSDVNNVLYPLTGFSGYFAVAKRGLGFTGGVNMFSVEGQMNKFWHLGPKLYGSLQLMGRISLPFKQPYINQRALGFGDSFLRGMEFYVIDGVAYAIGKFNVRKEILNFNVKTFLKSKTFNKIPFKVYAKSYVDMGYAYNKGQPPSLFNNKLLYTGGVGIDILTFYDIVLRLEYSCNQLGQKNLFLHNQSGF